MDGVQAGYAPFYFLGKQYAWYGRMPLILPPTVIPILAGKSAGVVGTPMFQIAPSQIVRVVKGSWMQMTFTGLKVAINASFLGLFDSAGNLCWEWPGTSSTLLGNSAGVMGRVDLDEVVLPPDYRALGGDGLNFFFGLGYDSNSTNLVSVNSSVRGVILIEYWNQVVSQAKVGYTA
jgi:hypothetical protein